MHPRPLMSLFFWVLCAPCALSLEPAHDPALATVRIRSHGASGTIIATTEGRSWILSCAHMLADEHGRPSDSVRRKPLQIDGPVQPYAPQQRSSARLLAWDYDLDLSLIEIGNGPFHYVPVAPPGHRPAGVLLSVGYDSMAWPVTKQTVTILGIDGNTIFTREKPWHGRSGGGLIDLHGRCLIGVVQGYEVSPRARGLYVSHAAVLRFMQTHLKAVPTPRPPPLHQQC